MFVTATLLCVGLAACTAAPATLPPTPVFEPRVATPSDTGGQLAGTWTITDPHDGMSASIVLNESGMWDAKYDCGEISGQWASLGGAFLATKWGGSMGCFDGIDPQPSLTWVEKAVRAVPSDTGWTLTDEAGNLAGSLTNGTVQSPSSAVIQPLPQGFTIGSAEGRWVPVVDKPGDSFVEFSTGAWHSSDGCNGNSGRWVDLGGGYVLATPSSISSQIGCENVPVAEWVGAARTAGFDGETLVLFDAAGEELGHLTPAR